LVVVAAHRVVSVLDRLPDLATQHLYDLQNSTHRCCPWWVSPPCRRSGAPCGSCTRAAGGSRIAASPRSTTVLCDPSHSPGGANEHHNHTTSRPKFSQLTPEMPKKLLAPSQFPCSSLQPCRRLGNNKEIADIRLRPPRPIGAAPRWVSRHCT